jgi:hypothetical protein
MRLIRMVGACLVAALALSVAAVASASAALPELGRCVAVTPGTGEFKGEHCNLPLPGTGNHDWLPGPGAKNKFEGTGPGTTLATPKLKVVCSASLIQGGEYTGAKTATGTLLLKGCINAASHKTCQSNPVKPGEIETSMPVEAELGFIKAGEKAQVGLDLKKGSNAPSFDTFNCGNPNTVPPENELLSTVEGSVIGRILPVNHMVSEFKLTFKALGGKQVPEKFETGAKDVLTEEITIGATKTTEEAALSLAPKEALILVNEEALEIKSF